MNRTVRRTSVAVPWSLFPRELSVGQVLSLSLLWRGHDCRTWDVVCASSPQGQRADFSISIVFSSKLNKYSFVRNIYHNICMIIP